jgi:hypothetical protein
LEPPGTWPVRAEVRDPEGATSVTDVEIVIEGLPPAPDVIVSGFRLSAGRSLRVVEVAVGQEFNIGAIITCWGVDGVDLEVEFLRDGVPVYMQTGSCEPGRTCGGPGFCFSEGEAGTYEYEIVADPRNEIVEADESNNRVSGVVVVVEG